MARRRKRGAEHLARRAAREERAGFNVGTAILIRRRAFIRTALGAFVQLRSQNRQTEAAGDDVRRRCGTGRWACWCSTGWSRRTSKAHRHVVVDLEPSLLGTFVKSIMRIVMSYVGMVREVVALGLGQVRGAQRPRQAHRPPPRRPRHERVAVLEF